MAILNNAYRVQCIAAFHQFRLSLFALYQLHSKCSTLVINLIIYVNFVDIFSFSFPQSSLLFSAMPKCLKLAQTRADKSSVVDSLLTLNDIDQNPV